MRCFLVSHSRAAGHVHMFSAPKKHELGWSFIPKDARKRCTILPNRETGEDARGWGRGIFSGAVNGVGAGIRRLCMYVYGVCACMRV